MLLSDLISIHITTHCNKYHNAFNRLTKQGLGKLKDTVIKVAKPGFKIK
jgi:hypothetical protein